VAREQRDATANGEAPAIGTVRRSHPWDQHLLATRVTSRIGHCGGRGGSAVTVAPVGGRRWRGSGRR
jgi:hypothetical protein